MCGWPAHLEVDKELGVLRGDVPDLDHLWPRARLLELCYLEPVRLLALALAQLLLCCLLIVALLPLLLVLILSISQSFTCDGIVQRMSHTPTQMSLQHCTPATGCSWFPALNHMSHRTYNTVHTERSIKTNVMLMIQLLEPTEMQLQCLCVASSIWDMCQVREQTSASEVSLASSS